MFIFIRLSSIEDALDGNKRILCLNEVHEKAHNPLEYTKSLAHVITRKMTEHPQFIFESERILCLCLNRLGASFRLSD